MWTTAINVFKENPVLGEGAGNFPWVVGQYQPREGNWPASFFRRDRYLQSAHSFYFQLIAEHGLVGILIIGFLIRRYFKSLWRIAKETKCYGQAELASWDYLSPNLLANALIGSMIGFLTGGIFLSVLIYPHFFYLLGMGAGLEVAYNASRKGVQNVDESVQHGIDDGRMPVK